MPGQAAAEQLSVTTTRGGLLALTMRPGGLRNCSASVLGLRASSPSSEYRAAGVMLPSVVGTRPPHHAVRKEPAGQSRTRGLPDGLPHHYSRPHCLPRPGDGTSDEQHRSVRPARNSISLMLRYAAATISLPQRNSVPSTHMRCRTPASLRASATFARFRPRRLATSMAQRFSAEKRVGRLNTALAAS